MILDKIGPWILAFLFSTHFAVSSAYASYSSFQQEGTLDIAHYVQEFGALGIVAFVVYWMMKRIDSLIKVLQQSIETSKLLETAIGKHNSTMVETQRQILGELRNLQNGVDRPPNKL